MQEILEKLNGEQTYNDILNIISRAAAFHNPTKDANDEQSYISRWQLELAQEIAKISTTCVTETDKKEAPEIIKSILSGEMPTVSSPSPYFSKIDAYAEKLKKYQKKQKGDLKDVLDFYIDCINPPERRTLRISKRRAILRLIRGKHFYTGSSQASENFKELVHRFANIHPDICQLLLDELRGTDFSYATQLKFSHSLYHMFLGIQRAYQEDLASQDKKNIEKLEKTYGIVISHYYYSYAYGTKTAVENIEQQLITRSKNDDYSLRLLHDLQIIRKQRQTELEAIDGQLKSLKKHIHLFCFEQGLPIRLTKQSKEQKITFKKDNRPEFNFYNLSDSPETFISAEKQENRRQKRRAGKIATGFSKIASVSEGIVPAVAFMALFPIFPIWAVALLIGIPAFIANYFLFNDALPSPIKILFTTAMAKDRENPGEKIRTLRILIDENGYAITGTRKVKTLLLYFGVIGTPAVIAGTAFGALTATQTFTVVAPLVKAILGLIGIKAGIAGILLTSVCVAIPAIGIAVGMTLLFVNTIVDIVRNKRWIGMKNYFKETYTNVAWKQMTFSEKRGHVLRCVFFEPVKLVLALALCTIVTIATLGFLQSHIAKLFNKVLKVGAHASQAIGNIAAISNVSAYTPLNVKNDVGVTAKVTIRPFLKGLLKVGLAFLTLGAFPIALAAKRAWAENANENINTTIDTNVRGTGTFAGIELAKTPINTDAQKKTNAITDAQKRSNKFKQTIVSIAVALNSAGQCTLGIGKHPGVQADTLGGGICLNSTVLNIGPSLDVVTKKFEGTENPVNNNAEHLSAHGLFKSPAEPNKALDNVDMVRFNPLSHAVLR